jgi:hypothetical protein
MMRDDELATFKTEADADKAGFAQPHGLDFQVYEFA